jgi:hypothetical protein
VSVHEDDTLGDGELIASTTAQLTAQRMHGVRQPGWSRWLWTYHVLVVRVVDAAQRDPARDGGEEGPCRKPEQEELCARS